MNRDVEERIVAMYFDNEDFEKNAKTTIETLGQLKEGLNLEEASKGFNVFEKIGKTMNFDKAQKGLTKIKSTISGMGSIFKKVFNLGPIDEAVNAVENFKNRYLNRVLGFDLAHTVANALEGAFRELTIQPITAGWSQYETKMDSVKTIMSSTGESIGTVQKHLDDLTQYANKTIYSLTDMTSNLGKFTNNGQKLEDSVAAMKGIANAAADAGQGAQQASMAMYNFSQAMGVGKMTSIDWKSIENANMATVRLKETFMEMAAANGDLQKEFDKTDKKYHYYITKNSKGQTVKDKKQWTEVTANNFRETLSKDWLTASAMMHALQVYSGESLSADVVKSWGITDPELIKSLEKIGEDALAAATQVRTFTKMMDALKESAQSGWADTFEWIFGNMEQGTTLWTRLNDTIEPILSASAQARNDILKVWAGIVPDTSDEEARLRDKNTTLAEYEEKLKDLEKTGKNKKGIEKTKNDIATLRAEIEQLEKTIEKKKNAPRSIYLDDQNRTGRDIAIDTFFKLIELAKTFGETFSEAFHNVFGSMDAKKLFDMTRDIEAAVNKITAWFTDSTENEPSRLDKIKKGLQGVFSIVKAGIKIFKAVFDLLKKLVAPVSDFLVNAFAKFGEFFDGLGDLSIVEIFQKLGQGLQKTWEKVKKFFTPQDIVNSSGKVVGQKEAPIITWLRTTWADLTKVVREWADENGLGGVWVSISEWWNNLKLSFQNGYNDVKKWWNASRIPQFFTNMWNQIVGVFRPITVTGKMGNTWELDSPIVAFFKNISSSVGSAFEEVATWWNGSGIPQFFTRMWNQIVGLFETKTVTGKMGNTWELDSPIVAFFKNLWTGIQSAYDELANWWNGSGIPQFFTRMWNQIVGLFETKTVTGKMGNTWELDSPIVAFFKNLWTGIQSAYDELANWWNGSGIPQFFTRMWNQIVGLFEQKEITGKQGYTWKEDSPIVSFFKGIWTGLESAYKELKEWWEGSGIPEFFQGIWNSTMAVFQPITVTGKMGNSWQIDSPIVSWLKGIWTDIQGIWDSIVSWPGWASIGKFFTDTWNWIMGLLSGSKNSVAGASEAAVKAASDITVTPEKTEESLNILERILGALSGFVTKVTSAVQGVVIPPAVEAFVSNVFKFAEAILKVFGDVLGSWGKILTGDKETNWVDWVNLFGSVIAIIGGLAVKLISAKWISGISSTGSIGMQFLEFAGGMLLISAALSLLTTIDQDKMIKAAGVIGALSLVIGAVLFGVASLNSTIAEVKTTGIERFFTNLINKGAMIGAIYVIVNALPSIIEAIGKAKKSGIENIGRDILEICEGVAILFSSISIVTAAVNAIAPSGIDPVAALRTALAVGAVAAVMVSVFEVLGGIPSLVGQFTEGDQLKGVDAAVELIRRGGQIMTALGVAIGEFFGAMIGAVGGGVVEGAMVTAAHGFEESTNILSSISESELNKFSLMLGFLVELEKSFGNANLLDILDRITTGGKLGTLASQLPIMGMGFRDLLGYIKEFSTEDMDKLREAMRFVSYFSSSIAIVAEAVSGKTNIWGTITPNKALFQEYLEAAEQLSEAVKKGLTNEDGSMSAIEFNAMPIIDAICNALEKGEYAISNAVKKMVNAGLQDVDTDDYTSRNRLQVPKEVVEFYQQFSGKLKTENGETIDFNSLISTIIGDDSKYNQLMGQFDTRTTELNTKMEEFMKVFNNADLMKTKTINPETGELVETDTVSMFQEQIMALSEAVNSTGGLEIQITPVFKMDDMNRDKLQAALDAQLAGSPLTADMFFNNPTVSIDFKQLGTEIGMDQVLLKLAELINTTGVVGSANAQAISGLSADMDSIAKAISEMSLYLDGDLLVGGIAARVDAALGRRSQVYDRTGVTFNLAKG